MHPAVSGKLRIMEHWILRMPLAVSGVNCRGCNWGSCISDVNQVQLCLAWAFSSFTWFPTPPTGTSNTITWSSDITSLVISFLLYVERDSSSPFLKLEVLIMFHIVIFFIKPLRYLLASSNNYCLAPPLRVYYWDDPPLVPPPVDSD